MGNWAVDTYDTVADAETAIEALDSAAVTIHVFGFKEGNKQKAITLIASTLEDDRIFVAVKNKKVIGFAGLQYHKKSFSNPTLSNIVSIYGLLTFRTLPFFLVSSMNKPKSYQLHLESLAVIKNEQGKGIGTKLLNATINYAKENNFSQIKLEVIQTNPKAKKLYQKMGFKTSRITKIPYPFSYIMGFNDFEEMHLNLIKKQNFQVEID